MELQFKAKAMFYILHEIELTVLNLLNKTV